MRPWDHLKVVWQISRAVALRSGGSCARKALLWPYLVTWPYTVIRRRVAQS